ncbi:MAG: DUF1062 domain-containing protein [Sphingobacterium sp.]
MRAEQVWEVKVKNTPLLKKKCPNCHSDRFYCSDKFRMNSNKKNIDIWLIYRCVKCRKAYNMTLFSRIKSELIDKRLFNKFQENNTELAWKYAFSHDTRCRNNVESDLRSVEYEVLYDRILLEDLQNSESEFSIFKIRYPLDFSLKLAKLISTCLGLSSQKLSQLIELKAVSVHGRYLQKNHKVKNDVVVQIDNEKLKML